MINDKLLADVICDLDAGVYILDAELRLLYMNRKAEELLGWRGQELAGKGIHDAIHYQKADGTPFPSAECPVHKVLALGQTYHTDDDVFTRRDGTVIPVRYVSTPIMDEGRIVAVGTVFHDIRAEKEGKARDELLREIDQRVLMGHPLDYILQFICDRLAVMFGHRLARVTMRDPRSGELQVSAQEGPAAQFMERVEAACHRCWNEDGPVARVIAGGRPEVIHFANHHSEAFRSQAAEAGISVAMVMPLHARQDVIGVLELFAADDDAFVGGNLSRLEDLVERIAVSAVVADEQQRLRLQGAAMDTTANAIVITDREGVIEYVNPSFTRLSGWSREEVLGRTPRILKSGVQEPAFYHKLWQTILAGFPWKGEVVQRHRDGHTYTVEQTITPISGEHGEVSHFIAVHQDITKRKEVEEYIQRLAFYDSLTGLPNRRLFQDRLEHAVSQARREEELMALFFLDLDNFKDVNDSLGHETGDLLLQRVADRLRDTVRGNDTVARLGGDEFAIIQTGLTHVDGAATLAEKVVEVLTSTFEIEKQQIYTGTSIGITIYPFDDSDPQVLVKNADTAMYRAKAKGGAGFEFFTPDMNVAVRARLNLLNDLHRALENMEFELHYQPQVSLETGVIIGLEALLRWHHPEQGLIAPLEFIPLAEESGLIVPIGNWVLREACRQSVAWQAAGLVPVRVAVNVSARQFRQGNIVATVAQLLASTGLDPDLLELEVTESALMEDVEDAISTMQQLRLLGVHLAIDDFGTGYSSMAYLKRFPVDHIKIASEFVRDMADQDEDAAIAKAIIDMGHSLHMKVIAEGVETNEQLRCLMSKGCDEKQGYFFSRPIPAAELETLMRDRKVLQIEI